MMMMMMMMIMMMIMMMMIIISYVLLMKRLRRLVKFRKCWLCLEFHEHAYPVVHVNIEII